LLLSRYLELSSLPMYSCTCTAETPPHNMEGETAVCQGSFLDEGHTVKHSNAVISSFTVNGILHKSVTGEDKQLCCYIVLNTQDAVSQLSELQTDEKCTNICQTCIVCTADTDTRYGGITALTRIRCNLYHTFEQMDWERLQTKAWGYFKNITLWAGNESIRQPTSKHIWCPSIVLSTK